jgi:formylglycine-generating enzyme required for sulfatase activity
VARKPKQGGAVPKPAALAKMGSPAPRAALGRADLLRLLVAWGDGAEQAAAGLTGFYYQAAQAPEPKQASAGAPASPVPAAPPAPASATRHRSEQYSVTLREAADAALPSDFAQRLADIGNAGPVSEPPAAVAPPPLIALASERRLVVLAEKHLRSLHNTSQWNVGKLVRQVALGLPPNKRRAQQQRLRWRGNAMVISMRRESEPLHADYRALAHIVQRRSGGQVPIYLHYQGEGWALYKKKAQSPAQQKAQSPAQQQAGRALPRLWRDLAQAPHLAGLGGLAVGWPQAALPQWKPVAMLAAWLPPDAVVASGAARLPLACWDVGQPLQLRRQAPGQFVQANPAQVGRLLAVLTLAVVADVRLLRALRCLLGLPGCTEVQVWNHTDVACNGVVVTLRAARREGYLTILQNDISPALREQAVALIARHHGLLSFEMLLEESLRAAQAVPGCAPLDHEAWFAHMAQQMQQAAAQGETSFELVESMAYFARQGHRTSAAEWGQCAKFSAAWALANREALASGKGLPASLPLNMVPALRKLVGGEAASEPEKGLRLCQVDGSLQFEMVDVAQLQERKAANVLAQWVSHGLVKWRSGEAGAWQPATWVQTMAPIELARHERLELTDGQTTCIVQHQTRPVWAQEWGRDRSGVYALLPNPWGAPVLAAYPRAVGDSQHERIPVPALAPVPVPARKGKRKAATKRPAKANFSISDLKIGLDIIGPFANLSVTGANGQHTQTFRYIAPGRFLMGSPEAETAGLDNSNVYEDERPQHYVTISDGFWLADTACTQGFWQAIMGENPSRFTAENQGGPNHPVEQVSWNMIQPFLQKLSALLPNCLVTLPTEAEWEYACRAGTATPFSFGDAIDAGQVNCGNYNYGGGKGEGRGHTVAVKDLPANDWGLYQMHGNVWEWCADQPRNYAGEAVFSPGLNDALGAVADKGAVRVLRGGGWISGAQRARSAWRDHDVPDGRYDDAGFRLAVRSKSQSSGV